MSLVEKTRAITMPIRCTMTDAEFDFDSRPEAIRRAIEARIVEGKMRPGDRLGLKSDLQKEFDVAGPTIAQALTLLTNDGLIAMRRGPGGGIFVERSRPVIRVGTRRLATGSARSLAENIETREWLTPLLAVSAARATERESEAVAKLRDVARRLVGAPPSFDTQRLIWSGHHLLVDLADNELVGHFYLDLLDTAEALIVDVVFPTEGIEGDQERQRIATHASMFLAVADGSVETARHHAELVRLVSRPLREPG